MIRELRVFKVSKATSVPPVIAVHKVFKVSKEIVAKWDLRDSLDFKGKKVRQAQPVQRVLLARKVIQGQRVPSVLQERKGIAVTSVQSVLKVRKAPMVRKVLKAFKV